MSGSFLEKILEADLVHAGLTGWVRELVFHPPRKWRFDVAFPGEKLAVEVEGGTAYRSRHTSSTGFDKDCTKYNTAVCDGWRVLRFTSRAVKAGEVVPMLRTILEGAT